MAAYFDAETGSLITIMVIDGQMVNWSIIGPHNEDDAAQLMTVKKAMVKQAEQAAAKGSAPKGFSIN